MANWQTFLGAGIGVAIVSWLGGGETLPSAANSRGTLEEKAQGVASAFNELTPKPLGDGMVMSSVTADGRTIVLHIEGIDDWRPDISTAEITRVYSAVTCKTQGIHKFIMDGGSVRMELKDLQGNPLPDLSVANCPS